jgi:hypothetical protein
MDEQAAPVGEARSAGRRILLPIVGAFVWYIPTQQALNDFWQSTGARPA